MFTKFIQENSLRAYMNKPKTQKYVRMEDKKSKSKVSKTKFHKNAKVMDYNHHGHGHPLEMKQPLVPSIEFEKINVNNNDYYTNNNNNNNNKEKKMNTTVRVKVLMTKDEAAKLLAKRKKEGTLEFKDVVNELVKIPAERVISVAPLMANSKDIGLASIFEEEEPVQG